MHTNEALFDALFREHLEAVVRYFRRLGCAAEEAEDLAQETFFRVYRSIESLHLVEAQRSWIFTVAVNVWRNRLRGRSAKKRAGRHTSWDEALRPELDAAPILEQKGIRKPDDPLAAALTRERKKRLREALVELPERMRATVLFRLDRELKYREIADLMDVSIDTIKTQLFQARRRLKEELGSYFENIDF